MKKKINFIKFIQVWGIIFMIGFSASFVAIDTIDAYRDFNFRVDQIRTDYIDRQKQVIKQEVDRVVDMIRYEKAQSESLTRMKIKSRVYEAYSIAQGLFQQNQHAESKTKIQQMILDALRSIRFENGSGYYFATRLDGLEVLSADRPQMEGLNLLNMQDTRGQYVIKDMIDIAKQSGEGFYEYHWTKPESVGNDFKKISFIKRFEPYDWAIGTGLYVDDVESNIKADILSVISRIRFGKEGYIFINKLNGDALVSNGKLFSGTKKLWEVFNEDPEKMKDIFEKEYNAALKPEGDYIYYSHIKLSNPKEESQKVSFICGIPDLQWLVGAGVYLDDVEKDIALMQTELNSQIKTKLLYFILIVIGIVGLFFLFFTWVNKILKNDFDLFVSFFNRAANSDEKINRENLKFFELDQMAGYANKMLTDRNQAAQTLRESEARYRLHFENVSDIIYTIDTEFKLLDISPSVERVLGYKPEDLIGRPFQDLNVLLPEYKEKALSDSLRVLKGERITSAVYPFIARDGIKKWGEVSSAPLIRDNQIVAFISVARDITKRKLAEEALRESENKFRNLFDLSPQAIALTELETGKLVDVNNKLCELTGYSKDELIGRTTTEINFYSDKDRNQFVNELKASGQVNGLEMNFSNKDGLELTALMFARFLQLSDKPLILTIFHDITGQKKLEDSLRKSQRLEAIGTLAGGVAHDFNNLLFPIIAMSEMLLDDLPKDSMEHGYVKEINNAGKRATDLVKQILTFSRQSEQKMIPVQIQKVLREVFSLSRSTIPTSIEISNEVKEDCGLVLADPSQVHQIVMNLITNAYHAVDKDGGRIIVKLNEIILGVDELPGSPLEPGRYAMLSVTDNGSGIDPAIIDKIFEPYFTTKDKGKGTGLGLSVVYGIVKEHGGDIKIYSEVGKGTSVNIYLPLITDTSDLASDQKAEKIETGTERILLVDDDESIAQLEKQMLERLGYSVTTRTSSLEALEAFRYTPDVYDLIITDMTMPKMTGDRLAQKLISIRPDIPVIIFTGFSERINKEKAAILGIKGFLMKPVVLSEMAKVVRKVLDEAKVSA